MVGKGLFALRAEMPLNECQGMIMLPYRLLLHRIGFVSRMLILVVVSNGMAQEPKVSTPIDPPWSLKKESGKLILKERNQTIAVFHYQDPKCLRPFFSQATTVTGKQVTRNYPPVSGLDSEDHASMHGGIWLGFGDINSEDFWRNKGRIAHKRFLKEPSASASGITFQCEDDLIDSKGSSIGSIQQSYSLSRLELGYCLVWTATLKADTVPLVLGDQEEMGLGVRVATELTEKNGGVITSSQGAKSAQETWGKIAEWVDYSRVKDGRRIGVVLIPDAENFKPSWFHNRDYGLMVANSFGNKAFTGGIPSVVRIEANQSLTLRYRIYWYECAAEEKVPIDRITKLGGLE